MAMVKINCPKRLGSGLSGPTNLVVCSECSGSGLISVDDTQSLNTINAASQVPLVETAPSVDSQAQLNEAIESSEQIL